MSFSSSAPNRSGRKCSSDTTSKRHEEIAPGDSNVDTGGEFKVQVSTLAPWLIREVQLQADVCKIGPYRSNHKRLSAFLTRRGVWLLQRFRRVVHAFTSGMCWAAFTWTSNLRVCFPGVVNRLRPLG